jgi:hypothetical protein
MTRTIYCAANDIGHFVVVFVAVLVVYACVGQFMYAFSYPSDFGTLTVSMIAMIRMITGEVGAHGRARETRRRAPQRCVPPSSVGASKRASERIAHLFAMVWQWAPLCFEGQEVRPERADRGRGATGRASATATSAETIANRVSTSRTPRLHESHAAPSRSHRQSRDSRRDAALGCLIRGYRPNDARSRSKRSRTRTARPRCRSSRYVQSFMSCQTLSHHLNGCICKRVRRGAD